MMIEKGCGRIRGEPLEVEQGVGAQFVLAAELGIGKRPAHEPAGKIVAARFLHIQPDQIGRRQKMTFALYAQEDDLDKVAATVDHLARRRKEIYS